MGDLRRKGKGDAQRGNDTVGANSVLPDPHCDANLALMGAPASRNAPAYRRLRVWQLAMQLAERVLDATDRFPPRERFGLAAQSRRAAISVAANIAEGAGQSSNAAVARYLAIARGSLNELDSHLELALRRGWIDAANHAGTVELLDKVQRQLAGLRRWVLRRAG